jgi:replicative DNA helicase
VDDNTADRLPPQDLDAEQAVLGCCLLEKGAMDYAAGYLTKTDFYREAHQVIWEVCEKLHDDGDPVDIVTVSSGLRAAGKLEATGGGEYLTALISHVPTSAHVKTYVAAVKKLSVKREAIKFTSNLLAQAYDPSGDLTDILGDSIHALENLQEQCHPNGAPQSMMALDEGHRKRIEKRKARPHEISTAQFGIIPLDQRIGGMEDFGYTLVMAQTNVGKTGIAIQCAISTAWEIQSEMSGAQVAEREAQGDKAKALLAAEAVSKANKKTVVIFGLEEGGWLWHLRMAGFCGGFDTRDARNSQAWGKKMWEDKGLEAKYQKGMSDVRRLPISFSGEKQTISTIETHCRSIKRTQDPVLIIIDYLQLVGKDIGKAEREEQEFRDMANRLQRLSDAMECPIMGLSQVTVSGSGKAQTTSAAQAKALENSADTVIEVERKRDEQTKAWEDSVALHCRKAKLGVNFGVFRCRTDPHTGRWSEEADHAEDPPPDQKQQRPDKRNE